MHALLVTAQLNELNILKNLMHSVCFGEGCVHFHPNFFNWIFLFYNHRKVLQILQLNEAILKWKISNLK